MATIAFFALIIVVVAACAMALLGFVMRIYVAGDAPSEATGDTDVVSRPAFRRAVIVSVALLLAALTIEAVSETALPPDIRAYFDRPPATVLLAVGAPSLVLMVVGYYGLYWLRRWGRTAFISGLGLLAITGAFDMPTLVSSGLSALLNELWIASCGWLIACAYVSPVAQYFNRASPSQAASDTTK